jgi:predicted DCC family thiol-disulfide oxidoreductase YuxK
MLNQPHQTTVDHHVATEPGPTTPPRGWILYDARCGLCTAGVRRIQNLLTRRGFQLAPLQSPWVTQRIQLTDEDLLSDLRLLLPDGRLLSGATAYLHVMRLIWWTKPLALLLSLPGLNWLFHRLYRLVATHRHQISRACGLPSPPNPPA